MEKRKYDWERGGVGVQGLDSKGLNMPGRGLFRVLTGEDGLDGFELLILLAGAASPTFKGLSAESLSRSMIRYGYVKLNQRRIR